MAKYYLHGLALILVFKFVNYQWAGGFDPAYLNQAAEFSKIKKELL